MAAVGRTLITTCLAGLVLGAVGTASAADLFQGYGDPAGANANDWYVTLGISGRVAPDYPGADSYTVRPGGIFSITRGSDLHKFSSVDDSASIALFDTGSFSVGAAGQINWGRDESDSSHLKGLGDIDAGVELGGFAQWFPTEWLRLRGELRYGVGGFSGIVGNLGADVIYPLDAWRFAIGPRLSYGGSDYMSSYFGITPQQALSASLQGNPLPVFDAGSGFNMVGATAQVTYNFRNGFETGLFGTYGHLLGDASSSPLTTDANQFMVGVSASYSFSIGKAWW